MVDLRLLPPSIQDERFKAMLEVIERLGALPLASLEIYDIDQVNAGALIHLAEQFNVLGNRGWALTRNEAERRNLIKNAIELHRRSGTPWAVRTAMALVGYANATITENPPLTYDGSWNYDGNFQYCGIKVNCFFVTLDPAQSTVSTRLIELIIALINEWKNTRSHLIDLRIGDISLFRNLLQYNGLWAYDGSQEYDGVRNI